MFGSRWSRITATMIRTVNGSAPFKHLHGAHSDQQHFCNYDFDAEIRSI